MARSFGGVHDITPVARGGYAPDAHQQGYAWRMANFVCILSPSPTIFKGYAVKNTAQVFQASCCTATNLVILQPQKRQSGSSGW
jgi:hypothetical protein